MESAGPPQAFSELPFYSAHFMDQALWEPFVRRVALRHGYNVQKISSGLPGTYPTFIAEVNPTPEQPSQKAIVVKFFGPLFDGISAYRVERAMGQFLSQQYMSIASPTVLAEGQLDQAWTYLIFNHIAGVSYGEARPALSGHAVEVTAQQMGRYMKELHTLTASGRPEIPQSPSTWREFAGFLVNQKATCLQNHRLWNDLPLYMLDQLAEFLLPVDQLLDFSTPPHLIHADLTGDHLLGRMLPASQPEHPPFNISAGARVASSGIKPSSASEWESLAIIDWGDSLVGNILYELVALHVDLFRGDKHLLRLCLKAYGLPDFYVQDFAHKALCLVLLHQFPIPAKFYAQYQSAQNLYELADDLFCL